MTDVQKFDPAMLMQGVKDRIKATFVSLIPDDKWDEMVQKEVDDFFTNKPRDGYSKVYYADFHAICREVLIDMSKIKILEFLETYKENGWAGTLPKANELLKQMIVENAPEIFASTFASMFQMALMNMRRN